jgi:hypothetical protein
MRPKPPARPDAKAGLETRRIRTASSGCESRGWPEQAAGSVSEHVGGHQSRKEGGGRTHAKGNVGEELGDGRGTEVDGLAVLAGSLDTVVVDGLLLPELVTAELEGTLDRVADLMGRGHKKIVGDGQLRERGKEGQARKKDAQWSGRDQ